MWSFNAKFLPIVHNVINFYKSGLIRVNGSQKTTSCISVQIHTMMLQYYNYHLQYLAVEGTIGVDEKGGDGFGPWLLGVLKFNGSLNLGGVI